MNITRKLNQTLTRWRRVGVDAYGNASFAAPVVLPCRWEGRTELFVDFNGREIRSQAVVYTAVALAEGDYVALGNKGTSTTTSTTTSGGSAFDPTRDAYEVKSVESMPNLRGTQFVYKAWLTAAR